MNEEMQTAYFGDKSDDVPSATFILFAICIGVKQKNGVPLSAFGP